MGNKRLIFAIIIVIILIAVVVGGFLYVQDNSKQATILQQEMSTFLEKNILGDEELDMEIKSTGNYGVVEKTVKDYINNVKSLYKKAKDFVNDSEISNIVSAENILADEEELTGVSEKVNEYKTKFDELENEVKNITDQIIILDAIEKTNVKQSYIDVYKNIMDNEALQTKLTNAQKKIEEEIEKTKDKVSGLEKLVKFLKTNSKYWEVNDGKLQFTNVNKLAEYYQLLNGDE